MFSDPETEGVKATWHSTTPAMKPLSHDRLYYFLPIWDDKPCVYIRAMAPDHRRRLPQTGGAELILIAMASFLFYPCCS